MLEEEEESKEESMIVKTCQWLFNGFLWVGNVAIDNEMCVKGAVEEAPVHSCCTEYPSCCDMPS